MTEKPQEEALSKDPVAALNQELEAARAQVAQIRQAHTEAAAEFEKSKARLERNHEQELDRARLKIATRMFEVADSLDRVIGSGGSTPMNAALKEGLAMVRAQFFTALQEFNVRRTNPKGEIFDPTQHEALSMVPVSDPQYNNRIIEVLRSGYVAGNHVLRAAQVVVGRAETPPT